MMAKSLLQKFQVSVVLMAITTSVISLADAEEKTFEEEYTYQASEMDSKVTSRTIALEQVKRILLEEIGTYLVSETDVKNFQLTKDKVTVLTAGIVKTKIIEEKWDGKTYYIKARISMDPQETARIVEGLRENGQQSRELEETSQKADEALRRIKELQAEIEKGQHSGSSQTEYFKAVGQLKWKEWMDRGSSFLTEEKYSDAIESFDEATKINPNNPWSYIKKGRALNGLGDYHHALTEFNTAASMDPQNPWIYIHRGVSYNFLRNHQQALFEEDKAISLDATIIWAYIDRGWAYIGLRNFKQALVDLNRAVQMDPKNPQAYIARAWAHNGLGNKQQSMEDLDKCLRLAPNNSLIHVNIAAFYAKSGEKEKALSELGKAISINGALRQRAKTDKRFQSLWNDAKFRQLVD